MKDLELKKIDHFYGTDKYISMKPLYKSVITEGVAYVAESGYAWVVTDCLAVIEYEPKVKEQPFISVKLKLNKDKAGYVEGCKIVYTDGNDNVLFTQNYVETDARKEVEFFWVNNVLMLTNEY